MTTIPASTVVNVLPGVLAAGGAALDLNDLLLTNNTRVPFGAVLQFASAASVSAYFGASAVETLQANTYFAGFDNATRTPGNLLVAQFNTAAISAYVRGGNLASTTTLTQLQALNGTLSVTIDGVLKTNTVNLSGATSFTNAAQIIGNSLLISGAAAGTVTGSISGTTFTAASALVGTLAPGQVLSGTGVTAGTYILAQLTGPVGGLGTYQVNASQTAASTTITFSAAGVTFDSVSGAFTIFSGTTGATSTITFGSGAMATSLLLTSATGAVLSQGAIAQTPAPFMNTLATSTRNWATFSLCFNPDVSGNDIRFAFSQWASTQNFRYVYVATDSDPAPAASSAAAASLGARITAAGYASTSVNWQPSETNLGAFVAGAVASINFNQVGGRITLNGKQQAGLTPGVTDQTTAANLKANGYNFYGALATASQNFIWYEFGTVSGQFVWLDVQVNSIWWTNAAQAALMTLLQNTTSIPYNSTGKAMIEQALSDVIQQGLAFGMYRTGVTLSGSQKAAVNAAAGGLDIASTLTVQGWYLLVGDASPTVRAQRGSPPCTFFYMDGEAVQQINLSAVVLL